MLRHETRAHLAAKWRRLCRNDWQLGSIGGRFAEAPYPKMIVNPAQPARAGNPISSYSRNWFLNAESILKTRAGRRKGKNYRASRLSWRASFSRLAIESLPLLSA